MDHHKNVIYAILKKNFSISLKQSHDIFILTYSGTRFNMGDLNLVFKVTVAL